MGGLLPLPACGERVGVRGRLHRLRPSAQTRGDAPSPGAQERADLSPQAGRGENGGRVRSPSPQRGAVHPPSEAWANYAKSGAVPDLAAVHFIARAITPPGRPRRFDTRFFAVDADAIAARIDGVVGPDTELVELVWLPIEESLKLDMPGITMAVLEELKIRTAEGLTHDLPVPFYRMQRGRRVRELLD